VKLAEWKRLPESSRSSLRAMGRELGTSHQLLSFYLKNLHEWQSKEYWRQPKEIRAQAKAGDRALTQQEEQQVYSYNRAAIRAIVGPMLRDDIRGMKEESERRPLCWQEIKALKIFARHFPEAQEVLQRCAHYSRKKSGKRFAKDSLERR
jgi:hypothetical protein